MRFGGLGADEWGRIWRLNAPRESRGMPARGAGVSARVRAGRHPRSLRWSRQRQSPPRLREVPNNVRDEALCWTRRRPDETLSAGLRHDGRFRPAISGLKSDRHCS